MKLFCHNSAVFFYQFVLLITHSEDVKRVKSKLDETEKKYDIAFVESNFGGECSRQEIERLTEVAKDNNCDCTIGLGGGINDQLTQWIKN